MKNLYTISFCLFSVVVFAQIPAKIRPHRLSFSLESGIATSYVEMPEEQIICCFGDCYVYGTDPTLRLRPTRMTSFQFGGTANFDISPKHRVGFGVTKREMGEMEPHGEELVRRSIDFFGLTARHQYKILNGSKLSFYISNAISIEKPKTIPYINLRNSVSHTIGLTCGVQLTRMMEASVSMIGRTAIRGFHENAFYGDKHRFGGGLMLGLTHRI